MAEFMQNTLKLEEAVCATIRDEKIDAHVVLTCSKVELAGLGIERLGDQKKLVLFAKEAVEKDVEMKERRKDIMEDGNVCVCVCVDMYV
jgi:hypothetical protein